MTTDFATLAQEIRERPGFQDRLITDAERKELTTVSRYWWRELEYAGRAPLRIALGEHRIAWRLSDVLGWVASRALIPPHAPETRGKRTPRAAIAVRKAAFAAKAAMAATAAAAE